MAVLQNFPQAPVFPTLPFSVQPAKHGSNLKKFKAGCCVYSAYSMNTDLWGAVIYRGMWVRNVWWAVENHCGWWRRVCKETEAANSTDVPTPPALILRGLVTLMKQTRKDFFPSSRLAFFSSATREHHCFFLKKKILPFPSITPQPAKHPSSVTPY